MAGKRRKLEILGNTKQKTDNEIVWVVGNLIKSWKSEARKFKGISKLLKMLNEYLRILKAFWELF